VSRPEGRTIRGRIRHERDVIPVPDDLRRAVIAVWSKGEACRALGIGEYTYDALVAVGGRVSASVVDRVRRRLAHGPGPGPTREDAMLDRLDLEREGG